MLELGLIVALEIVDLEKVVTPIGVLNKIAHEVADHAIFARIDIHLREHLVDCVYGIDSRWIWRWHAFDNVRILATRVIGINCEKGVKGTLIEPLVDFEEEKLLYGFQVLLR